MQLDKAQVLDFLKSQGKHDEAGQADQQLPDQVDTDAHSDILGKLGVNPQELLGGLGGKLGL
jgi:hypothetical protein